MSELIGGWRNPVDQPLPMTFQTEGDALVVQPHGELDCGSAGSLPGFVFSAVHDQSAVISISAGSRSSTPQVYAPS